MQVKSVALQVIIKSIRGTTIFVKVQPITLPTNIASLLLLLITGTTTGGPSSPTGSVATSSTLPSTLGSVHQLRLPHSQQRSGRHIFQNMGYPPPTRSLQTSVSPSLLKPRPACLSRGQPAQAEASLLKPRPAWGSLLPPKSTTQ